MNVKTLATVLGSLMLCSAAYAEEHPCKADFEKLCPGLKPGDGKFKACVKTHHEELSPACKEKMVEHKEEAEEFHADCAADVQKLCAGIPHGEGRIINCLKEHQAQTSPACQTQLSKKKEHGSERPPEGGLPVPPPAK